MIGRVDRVRDVRRPHRIAHDAHERRNVEQIVRRIPTRTLADGAHHGVAGDQPLAGIGFDHDGIGQNLLRATAAHHIYRARRYLVEEDGTMADVRVEGKSVAHLDEVNAATLVGLEDRTLQPVRPPPMTTTSSPTSA